MIFCDQIYQAKETITEEKEEKDGPGSSLMAQPIQKNEGADERALGALRMFGLNQTRSFVGRNRVNKKNQKMLTGNAKKKRQPKRNQVKSTKSKVGGKNKKKKNDVTNLHHGALALLANQNGQHDKKGFSNQGTFSFLLPIFKKIYCTLAHYIPTSILNLVIGSIFKYSQPN